MGKIKNFKIYKKALIIVDMVNGFVREGVLHDDKISNIIPRQIELIKENKMEGALIIFIKDTHDENSVEFERFGGTKHCIKKTSEAELVNELKEFEYDNDTISIEKNSTSFMEAEKFRKVIDEASNIKEVDIVGCCTDICVVNGSMGLSNHFNEQNRDVKIKVHKDAIATYNEENRKEYVDAACLLMEQQGIQLVKKR